MAVSGVAKVDLMPASSPISRLPGTEAAFPRLFQTQEDGELLSTIIRRDSTRAFVRDIPNLKVIKLISLGLPYGFCKAH